MGAAKEFNTMTMLMIQFQAAAIPLNLVQEHYMPEAAFETVKRMAAAGTLPFPCFRASAKAGWMVRIHDLAKWIDSAK